MSFSAPYVLLGLVAIPVLVRLYTGQQRRRARAAEAFAAPQLAPSVAPQRPGWRRHAPMLAFLIAIVVLIIAAARPQKTVAVPVNQGAIMLVNDVSSSMSATDVRPTRLGAAQAAAQRFIKGVPGTLQVGSLEFARRPILLQSPTTDHSLAQQAIAELRPGGGGTAIGDAVRTALKTLTNLRPVNGKRPPGAIVLLSDGASNVGSSSRTAAQEAAQLHIPIYTISLGTPYGTIPIKRGSGPVAVPVPVSPQELSQIAAISKGRTFPVADSAKLSAVYQHLAAQLGRKHVKQEITASFAGGALVLLLIGGVLSLRWFGRLV